MKEPDHPWPGSFFHVPGSLWCSLDHPGTDDEGQDVPDRPGLMDPTNAPQRRPGPEAGSGRRTFPMPGTFDFMEIGNLNPVPTPKLPERTAPVHTHFGWSGRGLPQCPNETTRANAMMMA